MYELAIAFKYLIPKRKHLSASIISLVSILVIALVIWLVLVFLSIARGIEQNWLHKLVYLNAPVKLIPTQAYFQSYYYLIDSSSAASGFQAKTVREKHFAPQTDPYQPLYDPPIPEDWPKPALNENSVLKDIVKETYQALSTLKSKYSGFHASDFEIGLSNIRLQELRFHYLPHSNHFSISQNYLMQYSLISLFDGQSPAIGNSLLSLDAEDLSNLLYSLSVSSKQAHYETTTAIEPTQKEPYFSLISRFFDYVDIISLKTPATDWSIPINWLPNEGSLEVLIELSSDKKVIAIYIPKNKSMLKRWKEELDLQGFTTELGIFYLKDKSVEIKSNFYQTLDPSATLWLQKDFKIPVSFLKESANQAKGINDLLFDMEFSFQQIQFHKIGSIAGLKIDQFNVKPLFETNPLITPLWVFPLHSSGEKNWILPADPTLGEGIIIPKSFKDNGILLGDRGYISTYQGSINAVQEERIPVYVAGFYDPGITPVMGKLILAGPEVTALLHPNLSSLEGQKTSGINIWIKKIDKAIPLKEEIQTLLKKANLSQYWMVETYHDYEFAKDLLQQFDSDKNLLSLIAIIIILVACSNIISMLILLVNDKKEEIGILKAIGASSKSIASIFAICGLFLGMVSSILGIAMAKITLIYFKPIIDFLSYIQGHAIFNKTFYGDAFPNALSNEAIYIVIGSTLFISIIAAIIPAIKAARINPATVLRS